MGEKQALGIAELELGKTLTLTREFADDAGQLIQDYESRGPLHTTLQMISNSKDAGAKRLDILLDFDSDVYRFADDGEGMLPSHIDSMINFGGSLKRENRVRGDGTRTSGYRGIALISLGTLAEHLYLETFRDGIHSVVNKTFDGPPRRGEPFDVTPDRCNPSLHGTTFELRGLKFKPTKEFCFDYLVRWIPWHRAITPSFQIYVGDGQKEVRLTPRSMENPDFTLRIDKHTPDAGHVYGSISIARRSVPEAGIYVSVNGETIGKTEDYFRWTNLQAGLAGKMTVVVEADGCEEALTAEKTTFRQGHPATEQLKQAIREGVYKARSVYEKEIGKLRLKEFKPNTHLAKLRHDLSKQEAPVVYISEPSSALVRRALKPESTTLLTKLGLPSDVKFMFGEFAPNVWGEYDPEAKAVMVNQNHYSLAVTARTVTPAEYRFRLKNAVINLLADSGTLSKDDFVNLQAQLWKLQTGETDLGKETILPQLVYSIADIARLDSRSLGTVRYIEGSGLYPNSHDGILGSDYLGLEARTEGWTTLHELIKPREEAKLATLLERFSVFLSKAGETAKIYAQDLGVTDRCYFIPDVCQDALFKTLRDIDVTVTSAAIKNELFVLGNTAYTAEGLVRKGTGLNTEKVATVLQYAKDHGLVSTSPETPGEPTYLFRDFVRAYGHMHTLNGQKE
jgi:hypothetical protein